MIHSRQQDKVPKGTKRSPTWGKFKKEFAKMHPKVCSCCGISTGKIELHHIIPFHLAPEREEDESNVIWLCENKKDGVNCHLFIGHLGNFKSFNEHVVFDAAIWFEKISKRPAGALAKKAAA
jgi:hypothetical protein